MANHPELTADDPMTWSGADLVRTALTRAASRVRHADLVLRKFVADPGRELVIDGRVVPDAVEPARLRRGAVLVAANEIIERCLDDVGEIAFDHGGLPVADAMGSFVHEWFPEQHRDFYDREFFRMVLVTAGKVAMDLTDAHAGASACVVEDVIRRAIGFGSVALCAAAGLGRPHADLDRLLVSGIDFATFYDGESDPADWFVPYAGDRRLHPYAETVVVPANGVTPASWPRW